MDFVTLADSAWKLHRHLSGSDNDDFANLEGIDAAASSATVPSSHVDSPMPGTASLAEEAQSRPLLSPSAEAELFLLATNFLLYVAMVIITVMIAKIYFPECLERREPAAPIPRSFNYRMVDGKEIQVEEEDPSDGGEMDEYLDSGDEDDGEGVADTGNELYPARIFTASRSSLFEFNQESMTKKQVMKRLMLCILMLNITFVTWGVLQERMLTRRYPRWTGEYFTYSYALVFTNRFWTLIISGILLLYLKPHRSRSTVIYEYSFPSISNMLSSWCQYEALRYVSFPATTLFKSFKLAPVMAMGKILGNKTYPTYDYFVALVIGVGITMFMTSTDDLQFGYDIYGETSATWTGILLLFLFLFFDSFTSQWQSRMFQRHRDLSMVELMFATSAFSTVLSFVTLIHAKELGPALDFVYRHSEIHLHFFGFSICSTIGQIFIFYTIKNFGAVVFTLIMTTRILLSIGLSCILYGHEVTGIGFVGLMMVMGAVLYRIKRKSEGQQLLKWQGMDDESKAQELVQEWHEHVDM